MIKVEHPVTQSEYQSIYQWLDQHFESAIGSMAFLKPSQAIDAKWKLLRLYDSNQPNTLLSVALVLTGGTCFCVVDHTLHS